MFETLGVDPFRQIEKYVREEHRRFNDRKAEAMKLTRGQGLTVRSVVMPEAIYQDLQAMQNKPSYLRMRSASWMGPPSMGYARVEVQGSTSSVHGTSTVMTYVDRPECECEYPQLHKKICPHQCFAAKYLGRPLESLLRGIDTLAHWRSQYSDEIGEFIVPGTAYLMPEKGANALRRPLAGPVKSGAPSTKRAAGAARTARDLAKKQHGALRAAAAEDSGSAAAAASTAAASSPHPASVRPPPPPPPTATSGRGGPGGGGGDLDAEARAAPRSAPLEVSRTPRAQFFW